LDPIRKRPNLTIQTDTQVLKVRIENGRAAGVETQAAGKVGFTRASREVVLSAGAFNSPQLLMLSGIGPADHLAQHGISTLVDNPHVGAHMMEHPLYAVNFETTAKGTLAEAESPKHLANFFLRRRGLLTSNVGEVGAFFHTRSGDASPYMQFLAAPGYFWKHGSQTWDKPAYGIVCSMVGAVSKGELRLRSADPTAKPVIKGNYFKEPEDMEAMVAAVERAREVARSEALRSVTVKEIHPGPASTRNELEQEIRRNGEHTYHASCTARIGVEGEGVVDPELRVYGVHGLRVADASVFPAVPHGNTNAASIMVGEKASDLIRAVR
jgi:choline dehydrogenase-like flavoprotein